MLGVPLLLNGLEHVGLTSILFQVIYQTELFLEKNRDYVNLEHQNLLCSSKCSFLSRLFALQQDDPSKSSYKFSSIASRFKVHFPLYGFSTLT